MKPQANTHSFFNSYAHVGGFVQYGTRQLTNIELGKYIQITKAHTS